MIFQGPDRRPDPAPSPIDTFLNLGPGQGCKTCQLLDSNPALHQDLDTIATRLKDKSTTRGLGSICTWLQTTHSYPYQKDALSKHLRHHQARS